MKAVGAKTVTFLALLVIISLLLAGCTAYSGLWSRFWERLGFNRPPEEKPESPPREEKQDDPGELVEEVPDLLNELEKKVFSQINNYRANKGLNTLAVDGRLVEQARRHTRQMGQGTVPFSHQGFQERVTAAGIPYKAAAENVAYNNYADPATAAVEGWIASEGHRRNIEGNFDLTGIGVYRNEQGFYYFTQLFLLSGGKK